MLKRLLRLRVPYGPRRVASLICAGRFFCQLLNAAIDKEIINLSVCYLYTLYPYNGVTCVTCVTKMVTKTPYEQK